MRNKIYQFALKWDIIHILLAKVNTFFSVNWVQTMFLIIYINTSK